MNPDFLRETATWLRRRARELGFSSAGVAPAIDARGAPRLKEWLDRGYQGEMSYLADRAAAYANPASVMQGARTLVMLTLDYHTPDPAPLPPGAGRVARYARGAADYHDLIHAKLAQLKTELNERCPGALIRGVVDTAPLLEREYAQLAGLGWQGKNTLLLSRDRGSYFFLACLLTSLDLPTDAPLDVDHCGTCTACLDACPTQAFVAPNLLDARRCISYLTIELKGPIPRELRAGVGDWLFGCDVCQEVCPWNRFAPPTQEPELAPREPVGALDAAELLSLTEDEFRARFRKTPLWRPKRRGILRNAAIVLGNTPAPLPERALASLLFALGDTEPLIRGAAAWALGNHPSPILHHALRDRLAIEEDLTVREEIEASLANATARS